MSINPIIYDSEAFAEAITRLRALATRPLPGESEWGAVKYYATTAIHDTKEIREILTLLGQSKDL